MRIDQILEAVDDLSPEELEQLTKRIEERKPHWQNGEEWLSRWNAALDKFWEGVSAEEQEAILAAIRDDSPLLNSDT